jgi:hypothetical protein
VNVRAVSTEELAVLWHQVCLLESLDALEHSGDALVEEGSGGANGDAAGEGGDAAEGGEEKDGAAAGEGEDGGSAERERKEAATTELLQPERKFGVMADGRKVHFDTIADLARCLQEAVRSRAGALRRRRVDLLIDSALRLWGVCAELLDGIMEGATEDEEDGGPLPADLSGLLLGALKAVFVAVNTLNLDDAVLRATIARSYGELLEKTGDAQAAVQVFRAGVRGLDQVRSDEVSFERHLPSSGADATALTMASITTQVDEVCEMLSATRNGAGAYGGSGVFGTSSQLQSVHQRIAALHMDLVAAVLRVEVALGVQRGVEIADHRDRYKILLERERRDHQGADQKNAPSLDGRKPLVDETMVATTKEDDGGGGAKDPSIQGLRSAQVRLKTSDPEIVPYTPNWKLNILPLTTSEREYVSANNRFTHTGH